MSARRMERDLADLRLLRQALRDLLNIDVKAVVPRISWQVSQSPGTNRVVLEAATSVIRDQWTRVGFRNKTATAIQGKIDAIVAKYPGVDLD